MLPDLVCLHVVGRALSALQCISPSITMISILFLRTYYAAEACLFYQNDLRHDDGARIDKLCKIEESSITD